MSSLDQVAACTRREDLLQNFLSHKVIAQKVKVHAFLINSSDKHSFAIPWGGQASFLHLSF